MNPIPRALFFSGAIITLMGIAAIWHDVMSDPEDSSPRLAAPPVAVAMTVAVHAR